MTHDDQQHTGDEPHPTHGEAELTRLADGSLPESEREALRAQVARSPELQARLREQEHAVGLVKATAELAAPAALRASMQELADGSGGGRARRRRAADRRRIAVWRPRASIALVALAAVLVAVVSVALHGGASPTVDRTARLALAAATGPPPAVDPSDPDLLSLRATGASRIPFPSYDRLGRWRASGVRHDTLDGRRVTTVFYAVDSARAGYSIVSGGALPVPRGSHVRGPHGVLYVVASSDGARVITWRRDGHTCVVASRSLGRGKLLALAAADERA
jgi:anti-sigma factor RsiW